MRKGRNAWAGWRLDDEQARNKFKKGFVVGSGDVIGRSKECKNMGGYADHY